MAQKIINARAKNKRDTSANWTANDPVLLDGEIIIVDTAEGEVRIKIGDGIKKYSQLPFEDEKLRSLLNNKLDKTATAADSAKLNGQAASHYAVDSDVVHKTGAETITGVKTFSNDIKVGSSSIGTNGYIEGTWLKTTAASNAKGNFCTLSSGWIYYRTPAEVLTDIGAAARSTTTEATLAAASWSGDSAPYTYTLTVNGVTDTSTQEIVFATSINLEQLTAGQNANIQDGGQSANTIVLKAWGEKPTVDLPIRVIMRG